MSPSKRKQQQKDGGIMAQVKLQQQQQQRLQQQRLQQQRLQQQQQLLQQRDNDPEHDMMKLHELEQQELEQKELQQLRLDQELLEQQQIEEYKSKVKKRARELRKQQREQLDPQGTLMADDHFAPYEPESPLALSEHSNDDVSPAELSPEFHPTSAIPTHSLQEPSVPSPGLDAYSTTSVSTGTRMSGVPDCDESPVSSYDDHEYKGTHPRQIYGEPSKHVSGNRYSPRLSPAHAPISPSTVPISQAHPMSLGTSPYGHTRMASLPSTIPLKVAPLPHQTQAHFFGTPELNSFDQRSGLHAGDRGYHFGFDTFPKKSSDAGSGLETAVLSGYEGGLEIYTLNKKTLEPAFSLTGLRGGVINAKLIPWAPTGDFEKTPLVAVVIHGPMLTERPADDSGEGPLKVENYQTTVEVYSLKTKERIDVLLKMPPIPISSAIPLTSDLFEPPQPTSSLHLRSDGVSTIVSCAHSGEVFVFSQIPCAPENGELGGRFGCLAKLWTSVQQRLRNDDANRKPAAGISSRPSTLQPILALSGRWLAFCPPAPASQTSSKAELGVPVLGKAPGLKHVTPPPLPTASTEIDETMGEGMMNKIVRGTTQELIHGARWVGHHGMHAWQSYWSAKSTQAPDGRTSAQPWGSSYPPTNISPEFPPTHSALAMVTSKDPGLVCLVDLESLGNMVNVHPFSTFVLSGGCSYLSFAPTGLLLYTASAKGDIQTVWDLMRTQHTRSSLIQVSSNGHVTGVHVRQVAQFSRMTEARVADVSWTRPNGEQIAVVTERGTVHLLDMQSRAFVWPPPRRRAEPRKQSITVTEATTASAASAVSMASTAIGVALGAAPALMNRARRSSANPQTPMTTGSQLVESATHGGRMIAASISSSIGKTGHVINQLRQTADKRVTMPTSSSLRPPTPGCVTWATKNGYHALYVIGSGLVRTFPSKTRRMSTTAAPLFAASLKSKHPRDSAYRDITAPALPDCVISDLVRTKLTSGDELIMSEHDMEAGNTVLFDNHRLSKGDKVLGLHVETTLPEAEIESSAPYQPFHTDRRIAMLEHMPFIVREAEHTTSEITIDSIDRGYMAAARKHKRPTSNTRAHRFSTPHLNQTADVPHAIWAFGQSVTSNPLDLGLPDVYDDFDTSDALDCSRALPASAMERTLQQFGEDDSQIVVTTRRRRGAKHLDMDDQDGFFEDDCDFLDFADQRV